MSKSYRKPNGEYTEDYTEYSLAWEVLYTPLMEATNTILHSFDPAVTLRSKENHGGTTNLPIWFFEAFNQSLKKV